MARIDFNRLCFLVIDDNAHMRRILRTLLHGFGAREVYEAEDGAAGLEAFTHYIPDIVITDWAMPIFDGLELMQMIRQPGANANSYVAIIMLTGHSEKKRVTAARDAGVTEFLCKPISAKGLYQRIINMVANPRPFIKTKTYFGPGSPPEHQFELYRPRSGAEAARPTSSDKRLCWKKPAPPSDKGSTSCLPRKITAASGYRMSLNKAFTIEIDRLLSISGARR
jgi:two-component system, chemotaxis family, chemotaxis protein CheY